MPQANGFNETLANASNLATRNADEAINRQTALTRHMQMVYNVYKDKLVFANRVTRKMVAKGAKSGTFSFTGTKEVKFLQRGQEATGDAMLYNTTLISLDDIMYSDSFILDVDEHISVLNVSQENAREDGIAIAKEMDIQCNIMINKASTLNHPVKNPDGTERTGGVEVILAAVGDENDADKLVGAIKLLAQSFDEANIPENGRYLAMKPATFYTLQESDKLMDSNYSEGNDYAKGRLKGVQGFELLSTNLLVDYDPKTKFPDKYTGLQDKYNHDCSNTLILAFNKDSAGILMGRGIKTEQVKEVKSQGTFIMTTVLKGMGPLNPQGTGRITKKVA